MSQCTQCGSKFQDNSLQYCSKCGASVKALQISGTRLQEENVGVELKDVAPTQIGFNKHSDLYFTNSRMVAIDIGRDQAVGYLAGGALGKALAKRGQNEERKSRSSLTLDEMIARNPKDNFSIPYDDVQAIKIAPPNLLVKGSLEIKSSAQSKKYYLSKGDYKSLKAFLPDISNLSGRLEVK